MNCANHPDRERVAFCQNCGKPLCSECTCTMGTAVFCEPCLAARVAGNAAASPSASAAYGYSAYSGPPAVDAPNPLLAGLLGLIPGVGAMYNGQYAKGIVHLAIFAVLVSLSHANDLFGLFVAGWIFYQAIEAYHTARARRDGSPLPNPFGFNDIGEKLGFGKSWQSPASPRPASTASSAEAAPSENAYPGNQAHFVQSADTLANDVSSGESAPPIYTDTVPPTPPPFPDWTPVSSGDSLSPSRRGRFPVGATLLIAFGLLFFLRSSGWLPYFSVHRIIPFVLIIAGIWIFMLKMVDSGRAGHGDIPYQLRLFRALRGTIWIFLIGVLFFLDTFSILSWSHSWPLLVIAAGLMKIFERSTYNYVAPVTYSPFGPAVPSDPTPAAPQNEGK